jgi:hypothetical protein
VRLRSQSDKRWRWLPITACLLVFLFAFHAKTAVYGPSLNVKPDTATASKLWVKDKAVPPRPAPVGLIPHSQLLSSQEPASGRVVAFSRVATGFTPVSSFGGLSPPLVI